MQGSSAGGRKIHLGPGVERLLSSPGYCKRRPGRAPPAGARRGEAEQSKCQTSHQNWAPTKEPCATPGSSLPPWVSGASGVKQGDSLTGLPAWGIAPWCTESFLLGPDLFQEPAEWLGWVLRMGLHSPSCKKCFPISNFYSFKKLIIYIFAFLFRLLWVFANVHRL